MGKRLFILIAFVLICSSVFAAAKKSPANLDAVDMKGNKVNAEIFKDYDVTMINIFTTWCGHCINEMPELNELYGKLPKNANLIGICADAYMAPDDLEAIMEYFELKFPVLKVTTAQKDMIYDTIGYPTTLFVDKAGSILNVVSGAPRNPVKYYGDIIDSLLRAK